MYNELTRLTLVEELFGFVSESAVDGNNNASERQLRDDALARKTGRTSKTAAGAKRRTIITSVLECIGKQLERLSLEHVIEEIQSWFQAGQSCFVRQVVALSSHRNAEISCHFILCALSVSAFQKINESTEEWKRRGAEITEFVF